MKKFSLSRQALGTQWDHLNPVIQRHYDLMPGEKLEVEGVLQVHHASLLTPILHVTGLFGLLFPEQGNNVRTTLINEAAVDLRGQPIVAWRRSLNFKQQDGTERRRRFDSVVRLLPRGDDWLILETVTLNQAVAMRLNVEKDGALVYQSVGFYSVLGGILIPVPTPSRLFIREWPHPTAPDSFYMAFQMTVPLFGNIFGYEGEFKLVS